MSEQRCYAPEVLSMLFKNAMTALAATTAIVLLSGCGGTNRSAGLTPPVDSGTTNASLAVRSDTFGEAARIAAKSSKVLAYVIDGGTNAVAVYSYPAFTLVQTLNITPSGECTDTAGDVWFVMGQQIVEYAHGGTEPIATLSDPGGHPASCAVSSSTGTLAVANITSTKYGPGNIALYAHAKGSPKIVQASGKVYFLTYDSHDDLFGDGLNSQYQLELFELPREVKTIRSVALKGATIAFPGGVQYLGNVLNILDQESAINYETHVAGDTATVTGKTLLAGASDCVQQFIYKNRLLCADAGNGDVEVYRYKKGGDAVKTVSGSEPSGVAVSVDAK
jgi:hypothetical protein